VIAHEIGHLAAGHLAWNTFLLPARVLPWLGPAYSRACEYTCDACGHAVVGDLGTSSRALAVLAAGGRTAPKVNLDAFVDQRRESGRFWSAVLELNSSHPFLPKRIAALREHVKPGTVAPVPRSALAYVLAPAFGFGAAGGAGAMGLFGIVAAVGILAAIAIPNFLAMQLRAKRSELPMHVEAIRLAEQAWQGAHGQSRACGSEASAVASLGTQPRDFSTDPAAACFAEIGWIPEGQVRGAYWVEASTEPDTGGFVVYGIGDMDGDGVPSVYRATGASEATMATENNVY